MRHLLKLMEINGSRAVYIPASRAGIAALWVAHQEPLMMIHPVLTCGEEFGIIPGRGAGSRSKCRYDMGLSPSGRSTISLRLQADHQRYCSTTRLRHRVRATRQTVSVLPDFVTAECLGRTIVSMADSVRECRVPNQHVVCRPTRECNRWREVERRIN